MTQETGTNIIDEYIGLSKEYEIKYGKRTIVLLQVGAFFEVYGLKNSENGEITGSNIEDFANVCQLNISEKKLGFKGSQVVMAGFRDYTLDKYLQKLTENDYNAVVYVQEKTGKTTRRIFYGVYSAGTYISCETDSSPQITNNIMCIWIETSKPLRKQSTKENIIYGVACANIFTGKSSIFEYETQFLMNPTTFDELERYVSVLCPSEVILISSLDNSLNETILQYVGVRTNSIHRINSRDESKIEVQNCTKQKYVKHLLSSFFGTETYEMCKEFENNIMSTQAFCYLMHFIKEHNPNLVKNIAIPVFNNTSEYMLLANHTLKQLNIIDDSSADGKKNGQLSSVLSFLNKCCSAMGRRLFQQQLLNPTIKTEWLNKEYSIISHLRENDEMIDMFRKKLSKIRDFEKICRQLIIRKLYPSSIYHLYESIQSVQQMNACIFEDANLCTYLCAEINSEESPNVYIDRICNAMSSVLEKKLYLDKCKTTNSMTNFDENIIRPGVNSHLDEAVERYNKKIQLFHDVRAELNTFMNEYQKNDGVDFVKIHETEKSGMSLHITKTRSKILKTLINNPGAIKSKLNSSVMDGFNYKDCSFSSASSTNEEISINILTQASKIILSEKERINVLITKTYMDFLEDLETQWFAHLENIANYVAKLDVVQCKTYVARIYNYCRPEILTVPQNSQVRAVKLRHCLIEQLQQNELYVTNDISLGEETNGILLYGTNAVGKTSIIRALGISIIMAQAGMFVPCSEFQYVPYHSIFSRILGNDNIFKGLSTFAVEMSELRIILKMADKNSLILGDELCSGTESESALSIFVAGLQELHEKESSFIFATHFHEIVHYEEIKQLDKMVLKHMSVIYDRERDCLLYDRKLKEGPGTSTYGLEVCKSLYLTDDFLNKAYVIRNKYFPEMKGELSQSTSHFNSKKVRGLCEYCKESISEEVHHIEPQKTADKNGFIETFHKNHPGNLLSVCGACHDKIHSENLNLRKKKTTRGTLLVRDT
jgi:DNA mismatch repair protein MutS